MEEAEKAPKTKLRWYQYRLAHLFIFVTICAIPCSWFACKMVAANERKEAVEAIERSGGKVYYEYESTPDDYNWLRGRAPGPAWFRNVVGVDFVADVVWVGLDDTQVKDSELENLSVLAKLKTLRLARTQVSDTGLGHLRDLTNLETLDLVGTQVTDAGLEHLKGMSNLKVLWLVCTQVTDDGVKECRQALPDCQIMWSPWITDRWVEEHIVQLAHHRDLSFQNTGVTDAGLEHLKGLANLKWLDLRDTQVTADGVKELQEALPNCEITF